MLEDIPRGLGASLCGKAREALPAAGRRRKPSAARATPGLASLRSGPRPVPEGGGGGARPGARGRWAPGAPPGSQRQHLQLPRDTTPGSHSHLAGRRRSRLRGRGSCRPALPAARLPAARGRPEVRTTERPAALCAPRAAPEAPRAGPRADFRPRRAGGRAGFVSRSAGRAASGPRAGRAPSSRRWAPGEWRVPGRGWGRQGPPVGRTGGLSAVGPARGSRSLGHGEPGSWQPSRPPPLGCSPARGPQLLSLRNVVWVNTRFHSLGSFPWLQGSHTQAVEPPASASVSQFSSPPTLPRWPGGGWGGTGAASTTVLL